MRALALVQKLARNSEEIVRMASARALAALGPEAAPAAIELARLLEFGDPPRASAAAFVLSEIGPKALEQEPRLVEALIHGMGHASEEVRHWSAVAIARLGAQASAAVPALVAALGDGDQGVRLVSAHALGDFGEGAAEAVQPLVTLLQDPMEGVRSAAARALAQIDPRGERSADALARLLGDPSATVRAYAAEALGAIGAGGEAAATQLARCMSDESPEVRAKTAEAVGRLSSPPPDLVLALAQRLTDSDDTVRAQVADALRQLGPAAAPAAALSLERLRDQDETTRFHAVEILEHVGPYSRPMISSIFVGLARALHDESALVRSRSSMALNALADLFTSADAPVFEAMNSPDETVRQAATEALGFVPKDNARVLAALRQQVRDTCPGVRSAACVSLCKLERPAQEVLPPLMAMLNDSMRTTQFTAIKTLGEIAATMLEARDTLRSRKDDPNPAIRACVHAALSRLEERTSD